MPTLCKGDYVKISYGYEIKTVLIEGFFVANNPILGEVVQFRVPLFNWATRFMRVPLFKELISYSTTKITKDFLENMIIDNRRSIDF